MPDRFDPYYKWLGIPPGEQPPHCYRLLGVSLFEEDRDAIESAAEGRMIQLRGYQNGPRAELSQKLLREVANARLTLLDPAKRATYDHELRRRLAAKSPAASAPPPVTPPPAAQPASPPAPLPVATPLPAESPAPTISGDLPRLGGRRAAKKRRRLVPAALGGVAVLVVVGAIVAMNRGDGEPPSSSPPIDGGAPETPPLAVDEAPATKVAANATDAPVDSDVEAEGTDVVEEPAVSATEASASDSDDSSDGVNLTESVQAAAAVSLATDSNASQPEASPPPNPAPLGASEAVERKSPPLAEEQQAAMAVVEEVYKLSQERTPVEQLQLVEELLKLARQSQGADQFALFTAAGNLAREAGDARRVCLARQELERRFTVDLTEAKLDELSKIARATRDEGVIDSLVAAAPMALAPAIKQDKWDQAASFLDALYSACQKPAGRRYAKAVGEDRTEITRLRRTWQSVQEARATLETNSDDADARLTVGRWECFLHDDWYAGLPHLAAGSDGQLKSLAEQDLAAGDDPTKHLQVADAWYDAAGSAADEAKLAMQRRARHWYEKARPTVTVRLVQLKVERRLEELAKLPSTELLPDHEGRLPTGRWVHVLGMLDPEQHAVAGKWARFREAVGVAQPHDSARFMIPVHVRGSYELEFDFTSLDGQTVVAVLPVGERACELVLAAGGGAVGGINFIDGKDATANATKVPMNGLPKERRLQMAVRVELNGENAKILVDFEGRPFVRWEGLQTSLTQGRFTMPHPDHPGFAAASNSRVIFHTARLRMLSGEGQLLPAVAETWASPPPAPAPEEALQEAQPRKASPVP